MAVTQYGTWWRKTTLTHGQFALERASICIPLSYRPSHHGRHRYQQGGGIFCEGRPPEVSCRQASSARNLSRHPSIEDALRLFFQPTSTGDSRRDFYSAYQKETVEHDQHFVKQYDEYLNTSLIFVSSTCPKQLQPSNPVVRPVCFPLSVRHSSSNSRRSWIRTQQRISKRFFKRFNSLVEARHPPSGSPYGISNTLTIKYPIRVKK